MATSIYDEIKTPKELIQNVMCHGFSTETEDICRAQDIFGRAAIEDLVFLANDIGRNNEKGEPDSDGSWSSSRRGTRDTFYMILFSIWSWEDATRFWNQHTNLEHKMLKEENKKLTEKVKDLNETASVLQDRANAYKEKADRLANDLYEAEKGLEQANQALSEAALVDDREEELEKEIERLQGLLRNNLEDLEHKEHTILVLKARLYDMMMEG